MSKIKPIRSLLYFISGAVLVFLVDEKLLNVQVGSVFGMRPSFTKTQILPAETFFENVLDLGFFSIGSHMPMEFSKRVRTFFYFASDCVTKVDV